VGELSSIRNATLPVAAALGGAVVPATIYFTINAGTEGSAGWGIPMATDIAFALGVLALLGQRAPVGLKVFLTALAIVDDIVAVLVIAFFYTSDISWWALGVGVAFLAALVVANLLGVGKTLVYAVLGTGLWLCFLLSGVHATIAGVLLALTVPTSSFINPTAFLERGRYILDRFEKVGEKGEHALHPWVVFGIMPVFALANAGLPLGGDIGKALASPVAFGIVVGLGLGKQLGITLFAWRHVYGAGWLAGIGFTMSLFITDLAFSDGTLGDAAKLGILVASLIAGAVGWTVLRGASSPR
jgi:NhaA family Na+:H+ antiporter